MRLNLHVAAVLAGVFLTIGIQPGGQAAADYGKFSRSVSLYKTRYVLNDEFEKMINNQGEGYNDLYGLRNFRVVLHGVLYRGGANNYYHRSRKRDNQNPLPEDGLANLCEEGFGTAIYLYGRNFDTASREKMCRSFKDGLHRLDYVQISPFTSSGMVNILKTVHDNIVDGKANPIYAHCWNGWHASGYISAVALKQFCGLPSEQAVSYWDANTDGVNKNPRYDKIRGLIRAFKPIEELNISEVRRQELCP